MDTYQSNDVDSTTDNLTTTTFDETRITHDDNSETRIIHDDTSETPIRHDAFDDTPTVNSSNPNYTPITTTTHPVVDSLAHKAKTELNKGQQHAEDIITKTKRILLHQWEQTRTSIGQVQKKVGEMMPKQGSNLIYWRNPIQSGIVFGVSLSAIITFMFLSSLAAISFWFLAFLLAVGLYKLYNYVMVTFLGRVQDDVFETIFPPDVNISERQAQALANAFRANGTALLRQARSLFLWENLTNSVLFGLVLFVFFYIGLSLNALTFALIGLIFIFTVPKIYQVYQAPIDRVAKQILDQINQILAKVTSKLPNKTKKA